MVVAIAKSLQGQAVRYNKEQMKQYEEQMEQHRHEQRTAKKSRVKKPIFCGSGEYCEDSSK